MTGIRRILYNILVFYHVNYYGALFDFISCCNVQPFYSADPKASIASAMSSQIAETSTDNICELLMDNGFDISVVEVFRCNKVDGEVFVQLDSNDMKELGISALGDRKKLQKLQNSERRRGDSEGDPCMLVDLTPSRTLLHSPAFPSIGVSPSVTSSPESGQNNSPCSEGTSNTTEQQSSLAST